MVNLVSFSIRLQQFRHDNATGGSDKVDTSLASRWTATASHSQMLNTISSINQNKASASKDLFFKSNYMTSIKEL